jgi:hypothetical protein
VNRAVWAGNVAQAISQNGGALESNQELFLVHGLREFAWRIEDGEEDENEVEKDK